MSNFLTLGDDIIMYKIRTKGLHYLVPKIIRKPYPQTNKQTTIYFIFTIYEIIVYDFLAGPHL